MTDFENIQAEIREDVGKGASRRLRRQGKIPAVLYGAQKDAVALTLDHDEMLHASENEAFYSSILNIKVADGRRQKVVISDLQRHPFKPRIMHMDFQRVLEDVILKHLVPIHFTGEEKSPAGKTSGVVIAHQITEIEVAALPKDLPEYLEVDLSEMDAGDVVLLSEIPLPEGVELPMLTSDSGHDATVAAATHVKGGTGTTEEEGEEGVEGEDAAEVEAAPEPEGDE